jgi:hypothetical protein
MAQVTECLRVHQPIIKDLMECTQGTESTDPAEEDRNLRLAYTITHDFSHILEDYGCDFVTLDQFKKNVNREQFFEMVKKAVESPEVEDLKAVIFHGTCFTLR